MEPKEKIALVKELREKTLLPLNECTKILEAAGWKLDNLQELIDTHRTKIAQKKMGRETKEGKIFTLFKNNILYFCLLSCETDFVSSNEKFDELGAKVIEKIANNESYQEIITEYIAKIGENITLSESGSAECNYYYLHGGKKLAAITTNTADEDLNKQICFHIVSMGAHQDMSTVENLLKQNWFASEQKTVQAFLQQNNVAITNLLYFE